MPKNNHYTSDHWKVGGQGFSGENVLHEVNKQKYAQAQKSKEDNASLIPGQNEEIESDAVPNGGEKSGGNSTPSSNSSSSDY